MRTRGFSSYFRLCFHNWTKSMHTYLCIWIHIWKCFTIRVYYTSKGLSTLEGAEDPLEDWRTKFWTSYKVTKRNTERTLELFNINVNIEGSGSILTQWFNLSLSLSPVDWSSVLVHNAGTVSPSICAYFCSSVSKKFPHFLPKWYSSYLRLWTSRWSRRWLVQFLLEESLLAGLSSCVISSNRRVTSWLRLYSAAAWLWI